jgi:hypothetical protein
MRTQSYAQVEKGRTFVALCLNEAVSARPVHSCTAVLWRRSACQLGSAGTQVRHACTPCWHSTVS